MMLRLISAEKVVCGSTSCSSLTVVKVKNKVCRLMVGLKVLLLCSHLAVMHIRVCYGQTMFGYNFFLRLKYTCLFNHAYLFKSMLCFEYQVSRSKSAIYNVLFTLNRTTHSSKTLHTVCGTI